MNTTQIIRAHRKLWERCTQGDGYQPWGYDLVTLKITKPLFVRELIRLDRMYREANAKEDDDRRKATT